MLSTGDLFSKISPSNFKSALNWDQKGKSEAKVYNSTVTECEKYLPSVHLSNCMKHSIVHLFSTQITPWGPCTVHLEAAPFSMAQGTMSQPTAAPDFTLSSLSLKVNMPKGFHANFEHCKCPVNDKASGVLAEPFWITLKIQERQGNSWESPVESHKDDYGPGASSAWGKAETPGNVHPGEDSEGIL